MAQTASCACTATACPRATTVAESTVYPLRGASRIASYDPMPVMMPTSWLPAGFCPTSSGVSRMTLPDASMSNATSKLNVPSTRVTDRAGNAIAVAVASADPDSACTKNGCVPF